MDFVGVWLLVLVFQGEPKAHVFAQLETEERCERLAKSLRAMEHKPIAVCVPWHAPR